MTKGNFMWGPERGIFILSGLIRRIPTKLHECRLIFIQVLLGIMTIMKMENTNNNDYHHPIFYPMGDGLAINTENPFMPIKLHLNSRDKKCQK